MASSADGSGLFEGQLVTAGGGFASVRCILSGRARRLAGASGVVLRTGGSDGRDGYKLTAKTDGAVDGIMYQATLSAKALSEEGALRVPFSAFTANFRGRPIPSAPPLQGKDIEQMGLMLSRFSDHGTAVSHVQPGSFWLRLRAIEADFT
jgi:NADH dehydrogenase [ubiquinone] 1 alpha subcomplex assembly factor 1